MCESGRKFSVRVARPRQLEEFGMNKFMVSNLKKFLKMTSALVEIANYIFREALLQFFRRSTVSQSTP